MAFNLYGIITVLIVLTAVFSYINTRFIKLPATIGIMLISLVCSMVLLSIGKTNPELIEGAASVIRSLDFETLLIRMMLSFLLFAGAIHIDVQKLRRELTPIATYATVGVLLSTTIIGVIMYFLFNWFGLSVPVIHCLLFGALISPTDPIAVLGILKNAKIPPSMEIKIAGESLFNDGVGVVIFTSLLQMASIGTENLSAGQIALLFVKEAGGGIIWGLLLGYIGFLSSSRN